MVDSREVTCLSRSKDEYGLIENTDELRNGDKIDEPNYSQPLSTAIQIALVLLLKSFGIAPKAVVGHSSGEIAAAYETPCTVILGTYANPSRFSYTIGALSLHSACKVSYFRGLLAGELKATASLSAPSSMISVNLAEDEVEGYIDSIGLSEMAADVTIACVNSPQNCTLSGSETAVDALKQQFDKDGIFAQKLKTGVAYHSPYMTRIADEYLTRMGSLQRDKSASAKAPDADGSIPMVSSVTGKLIHPDVLATPQYWVENMVSTVRFSDAVQVLVQETPILQGGPLDITDLVEVGPHPALRRPVQDTLQKLAKEGRRKHKHEIRYLSVLHKSRPAAETALELAGQLFCYGHPVSLAAVNLLSSTKQMFLVDGPGYPFDHSKRYWAESRLSRNFRLREAGSGEILGARVYDWNPLEPRWRNFLSVESTPWIGDHIVSLSV